MKLKESILAACSANHIPEGSHGLWYIRKFSLAKTFAVPRPRTNGLGSIIYHLPPGHYTQLFRYTEETLHTTGELVMQDTPDELNTHLNFMLRARGDVLITGLGLGCCARGCAANPNVRSVTVIERDDSVLRLVKPHMPENIQIIHAEAEEWTKTNTQIFDCAWHDLWSDPDKGEPHLQLTHSNLILNLIDKVRLQGAWQLPRWYKRPRSERLQFL